MRTGPDPGLQPERTELAWRRTLLATAVSALVAMRVLEPWLGLLAVPVGVLGLVVALVLRVGVHRRGRAVTAAFSADAAPAMPGAGLLLALAVLVAAGALLALLTTIVLARPVLVAGP